MNDRKINRGEQGETRKNLGNPAKKSAEIALPDQDGVFLGF